MGYSHRTKWTDDLIKAQVMEVVNAYGLDRMPSRSECVSYFHNNALAAAVTKRYGWYNLAKELGLQVKDSEARFGKLFENMASDLLISQGFDVRKMSYSFPYDLLVDGCVKVDVKASKLFRGNQGNFYTFCIEKPFATCDFYMLMAVNDDDTINRKMVVPSNQVISNSQISIGEHKSRYHQYTDRFDLLETASDFWSGLMGDASA